MLPNHFQSRISDSNAQSSNLLALILLLPTFEEKKCVVLVSQKKEKKIFFRFFVITCDKISGLLRLACLGLFIDFEPIFS